MKDEKRAYAQPLSAYLCQLHCYSPIHGALAVPSNTPDYLPSQALFSTPNICVAKYIYLLAPSFQFT
jgi:hypothetical protein